MPHKLSIEANVGMVSSAFVDIRITNCVGNRYSCLPTLGFAVYPVSGNRGTSPIVQEQLIIDFEADIIRLIGGENESYY